MPGPLTHDFRESPEFQIEQRARASLAIVDLESYRSFSHEGADRLDLLQHLCREIEALRAVMWETPDALLRLRLSLARDHRAVEAMRHSGHHVFADGWVRTTGGELGLVGHDRLLESAGQRTLGLLQGRRSSDPGASRLLRVPSGVYAITVFSSIATDSAAFDYAIVLRQYPHPPPRLQPVRLGSLIPWAGQEAALHARPFGL